jgi:hypothetical protein
MAAISELQIFASALSAGLLYEDISVGVRRDGDSKEPANYPNWILYSLTASQIFAGRATAGKNYIARPRVRNAGVTVFAAF